MRLLSYGESCSRIGLVKSCSEVIIVWCCFAFKKKKMSSDMQLFRHLCFAFGWKPVKFLKFLSSRVSFSYVFCSLICDAIKPEYCHIPLLLCRCLTFISSSCQYLHAQVQLMSTLPNVTQKCRINEVWEWASSDFDVTLAEFDFIWKFEDRTSQQQSNIVFYFMLFLSISQSQNMLRQ